jgi:hypothetical protein
MEQVGLFGWTPPPVEEPRSVDLGEKYETARGRLFELLSDLRWHSFRECSKVGGLRYGSRLLELRRLGYKLEDAPAGGEPGEGKLYRLISLTPDAPQAKRVRVMLTEHDADLLSRGQVSPSAAEDVGAA